MTAELISKIKTLANNSDYRIADIVYKKGVRWVHSAQQVLSHERYNDTILKNYLLENGINKPFDKNLLKTIIQKHKDDKKMKIPDTNELVVHLRMGDVVVNDWFLRKPYLQLINNMLKTNSNINKVTIVTCFAYQVWSPESLHLRKIAKNANMWNFTEEKQQQNITKLTLLLNSLKNNLKINIDIVSNEYIDEDICYCVNSKYFIEDVGGFSQLMKELHTV